MLGLLEEMPLQYLLRAQGVAAVDQDDLAGDVGEVEGLFHRRVATDLLVTIKEAVTGGAGGDAAAAEFLLGWQAQIAGTGAGGDDEGVAAIDAAVAGEAEGALAQIHLVDVVQDDLSLEALGVAAHPLHEVRALDAIGVAGPVIHVRGRHQLAALFQPRDQDRVQVGPGAIDGGRVARWPGTQDQEAAVFGRRQCLVSLMGILRES